MDKKSNNGLFARIRYVKNIEIYAVIILVLVMLLALYPSSEANTKSNGTLEETRLSEVLSEIKGAGEVACMITKTDDGQIEGVIIVADGAKDVKVRIELIKAAMTVLEIENGDVEVFERK